MVTQMYSIGESFHYYWNFSVIYKDTSDTGLEPTWMTSFSLDYLIKNTSK